MNPGSRVSAVTATVLLAMIGGGVWLGVLETFGGYVVGQRIFMGVALFASIGLALLHRYGAARSSLTSLRYFVYAQICFWLSVAIGQAYYFGPSSPAEFGHLLFLAFQGRL